MHCADTCIQASEATIDYINTCCWMGWPDLPVPLPIPDGEACIGYRNGRFGMEIRSNWKEYAGACLLSPLRANRTYRFRFYLGFTNSINSPSTAVVFFGTPDCDNLPFGIGNEEFGCPTNGPGWVRMGSVHGSGANTWIEKEITITPNQDIYAIAIGPDCPRLSATTDVYYFFDNLVLADEAEFEFEITTDLHPCADDFFLQVVEHDSLQYQWYKNGIALVGETGSRLSTMYGEGHYQVRMLSETECKLSRAYNYQVPFYRESISRIICEGESFDFQGRLLEQTGFYSDTLQTANGCDSVVLLDLNILSEKPDTVVARIFEGESYSVGPYRYNQPGVYLSSLQSEIGCDSVVYLDLDFYSVYAPNVFSPNSDGINDYFNLFGGEDLLQINSLKIFDRWGSLVYEGHDLPNNSQAEGWDGRFNGKIVPNGIYTFMAFILLDDGKERLFSGSVLLMR